MKTAVSYRSYRLLWYFRRLFGRQLDLPVLVGSFSPTTLMTHNPVVVHSHDNLHHVPCLFGPSLLFQRLLKGKVKKQEACSRLSDWDYPLAVCAYNGKWSQWSITANYMNLYRPANQPTQQTKRPTATGVIKAYGFDVQIGRHLYTQV